MERDIKTDLLKIISKLSGWTPFASDPSLRNIATGVVASDVNVHKHEYAGKMIIGKMIGKPVFTCSFKRKNKKQNP